MAKPKLFQKIELNTTNISQLESNKANINHQDSTNVFGVGSDQMYGHLKLSDSTNSTSDNTSGIAATPKAVKSAYDLSSNALPKSGGKMTGNITYDDTLEFSIGDSFNAYMRLYGTNYSSEANRGKIVLKSKPTTGGDESSLELIPNENKVKLGSSNQYFKSENTEYHKELQLKNFDHELTFNSNNNEVKLQASNDAQIKITDGDNNNKVAIKGTNEVSIDSDTKVIIGSEYHNAGIRIGKASDKVNICEMYRGSAIELVGCTSNSTTKYINLCVSGTYEGETTTRMNKIKIDGNADKITLESGTVELKGIPTAPTAAAGTNTTQIATTAFVQSEITNALESGEIVDASEAIWTVTESIPENTIVTIPNGVVYPYNKNAIRVSVNGLILSKNVNYEEVSSAGMSSQIKFLFDVNVNSVIQVWVAPQSEIKGSLDFIQSSVALTNENVEQCRQYVQNAGTINLFDTVVELQGSTIDVSLAGFFRKEVTSDITFDFINCRENASCCVTLVLINGGNYLVEWDSSVYWANGIPSTLTENGIDVITFFTINGGTTWYATPTILNAKAI